MIKVKKLNIVRKIDEKQLKEYEAKGYVKTVAPPKDTKAEKK